MTLIVCPLNQVAAVCAQRRPSHLLTLLSPAGASLKLPRRRWPPQRLAIACHDIVEPQEGLVAPDAVMVRQILDFGEGWQGPDPMLIHCWAGISRSTAAAYVLACLRRPDVDEAAVAMALREASPTATPNRLIVALADEMMQRKGRMTAAITAVGRGAETDLGRAFDLDPSRF